MTDSRTELEHAAAELADGRELDWSVLEGKLSARELAALRVLEQVQLKGAVVSLASGFELRGELGRGSMGRVQRAFDRSLQREVALKIIAPEGGMKPEARARFVAEARL